MNFLLVSLKNIYHFFQCFLLVWGTTLMSRRPYMRCDPSLWLTFKHEASFFALLLLVLLFFLKDADWYGHTLIACKRILIRVSQDLSNWPGLDLIISPYRLILCHKMEKGKWSVHLIKGEEWGWEGGIKPWTSYRRKLYELWSNQIIWRQLMHNLSIYMLWFFFWFSGLQNHTEKS